MTGIKASMLARLQGEWRAAKYGEDHNACAGAIYIENIRAAFTAMGLDLNDDSTYELLEDDLTKLDFDRTETSLKLTLLLDSYRVARSTTGYRTPQEQIAASFEKLKAFIKQDWPEFKAQIGKARLPANTNITQQQELALINNLIENGALENELKQAALALAKENFREVYALYNDLDEGKTRITAATLRKAINAGKEAAHLITHYAGDIYKPEQIPLKRDFYGGWTDEKATFSLNALSSYIDDLILHSISADFSQALTLQEQGHYIVRTQHTGANALTLPVQEVLYTMQERGYDLQAPETYEAIGTDQDTFWDAYRKERQEAYKHEHGPRLLKPEIR